MASLSACHADDPGSIPGRGEVGTIAHVSGAASPRSMVNTELACMCTRIQNPLRRLHLCFWGMARSSAWEARHCKIIKRRFPYCKRCQFSGWYSQKLESWHACDTWAVTASLSGFSCMDMPVAANSGRVPQPIRWVQNKHTRRTANFSRGI